jgi:hypothetical protein
MKVPLESSPETQLHSDYTADSDRTPSIAVSRSPRERSSLPQEGPRIEAELARKDRI